MDASDVRSYLMAAEAAAEIVSQNLEILLSDPVCAGCLSMETHVKDTKGKLAVIQELLSPQYLQSETTEWWRLLFRAMYYAEESVDKFHFRQARERHKALHVATRPLATLVSKYMLRRDLSYLVNDMNELCQDKFSTGKKEAAGERNREPARVPWRGEKFDRLSIFWQQQEWRNYLCRENEKQEIMKRIEESMRTDHHTISILGKQGVGKTFLARWVYREASYQSFEWRAWVHVLTYMDEREFLLEILKQVQNLRTEEEHMTFEEITQMLRRKFINTQRFLIVLDDVRPSNKHLFLRLAMIIPGSSGCIITTTQDAGIAQGWNSCGPGPIELTNLSDEENQRMLAMKLYREPHVQRLTQEENNILKRCPPLPLCISLLGGLMSNGGEQEHAAFSKDSSMMTVSNISQLSYDRLPVHLKPCFIFVALFPAASVIPTRRLVRLWLAEGLLNVHCYNGQRKMTRTPEEVGETFILELADRNVIDVVSWRADGSPKACHMLSSLYDMIHPIAMGTGFLYVHAASKSNNENGPDPTGQQQQLPAQPRETKVRWLAEHTNIVRDSRGSLPGLNLGHVRSFLSFCLRRGVLTEDISTVLRKMTSKTGYCLLRVLDLEGVYKPSLHGVLHKLVLLKYLGLRSTVLDSIPSAVADLQYLETLDIKDTNISSLPNSFWKARNLRHLHLNWFCINLNKILKACSNNDMALTKLQTLSGLVIGEVKEDLMTGRVNILTTLTTLKLFLQHLGRDTSGAAGKRVASWITGLTNLRSLTLGVFEKKPAKLFNPATWIGPIPELSLARHHGLYELYLLGQLNNPIGPELLPGSLRVLTLSGSMVGEDMMAQLGDLLKNLRTLRLLANSFLVTSLKFTQHSFRSLMILKFWKLPRLEKVIIEEGAMLHLKELEFRHLNAMKAVEGLDMCKELETIICVVEENGAQGFIDDLNMRKGKTKLHKIEEFTEDYDSRDEDELWS